MNTKLFVDVMIWSFFFAKKYLKNKPKTLNKQFVFDDDYAVTSRSLNIEIVYMDSHLTFGNSWLTTTTWLPKMEHRNIIWLFQTSQTIDGSSSWCKPLTVVVIVKQWWACK